MQLSTHQRARGRGTLVSDLGILITIGILLLAATVAGSASLYKHFYSPSAFVEEYLSLLAEGRTAEALLVPGVDLSAEQREKAGIDATASDALLRSAALSPISDVAVVNERNDGDVTFVTVDYVAGIHSGSTTFQVKRDGWIGIAPGWRFAQSPLSVIELTVLGSDQFAVNGFSLDRRQVAALGIDSAREEPVPLLVFSPGLYTVSVDTAIATTPGVSVLADAPLTTVPVDVQTTATTKFTGVVQEQVEAFLTACATQKVLQPTDCPFGMLVQNYITDEPTWSIPTMPQVTVEPDGAEWKIAPTPALAHLSVEVQLIYDGTIEQLEQDVPFTVTGEIHVLPDGSVSIIVGGAPTADT
ncbi:hypothetical protein [Microbacterium sp. YY-01]|uniref:hypothetical protein n=1 Tax=Microbacterium sp. YY-01 TaxID=3421634 RepID=UPI003D182741